MSDAPIIECDVCTRHCRLAEGQTGACRARRVEKGRVMCATYGIISSLALDPIEKKPIARFHPGHRILSVGGFGCNMRCPFCQNYEISQIGADDTAMRCVTPMRLADEAERLAREADNLGLAYTYNEPLVGWEFLRDCAREIHARGLLNVIVSNGMAEAHVIEELAPLIDAANIDLKAPSQDGYDKLGGNFDATCRTIAMLHAAGCHVEVTTLIVPGFNDTDDAMERIVETIAMVSPNIPFHVTRFFPRFHMIDAAPTPVADVLRLAKITQARLMTVLTGNI